MAHIENKNTAELLAPEINPDKVCFVIAKARELDAEDEGLDADDSNPTDDGSLSILTDEAYDAIHAELAGFIEALDADEKNELVALAWTGRGDYSATEWRVAVAEARAQDLETSVYLIGMPLLSDYLEAGLAEFEMSCNDFDARKSASA